MYLAKHKYNEIKCQKERFANRKVPYIDEKRKGTE